MIILDFGSGATCNNDIDTAKRMIDELAAVDRKIHRVIIKWQLFEQKTVPYVPALDLDVFDAAYKYATGKGYETTASVFDSWSIEYLIDYDIPFVKLACRDWSYPLLGYYCDEAFIVSVPNGDTFKQLKAQWAVDCMCCVPKYPATALDYVTTFTDAELRQGISDHTESWFLYNKYRPVIYECHYRLKDSTGPDAEPFARTPEQLGEVL